MFAIYGFLVSIFTKSALLQGLKWIAERAAMLSLVTIILPVALYGFVTWFMFDLAVSVISHMTGLIQSSGVSAPVIAITGLAGYIGDKLHIVQLITLYLSAVSVRFMMGFIPFLK